MTDLAKSSPSNSDDAKEKIVLADPFIGFELEGRYCIKELIGSGGWGNVYKGYDLNDAKELAVKIVHKHHLKDESTLKRFELEAKMLSRIQSPFIVKVIGYGISPTPYIIMEYFDGVPLNDWLKTNGPMDPALALELFLQLCGGLTAAESMKIVHRDLKPANILIKTDGDVEAKILDFGIAKFLGQTISNKLTSTGEILGSPPYMSPEHWKGQCDNRSDIYSLGCIMYEVLSGQPAFHSEYGIEYMSKHLSETPKRISEVNPKVKTLRAIDDVVSKCMQKVPANRYESSAACIADLKQIQQGNAPRVRIAGEKRFRPETFTVVSVAVALPLITAVCLYNKEPLMAMLSPSARMQRTSEQKIAEAAPSPGGMSPITLPERPEEYHDKTLKEWTLAIQKTPSYSKSYYERGILHFIRREFTEAYRDLTKAIQLDPGYAKAYIARSFLPRLNNRYGDYDKALDDANKAIELRPGRGRGYFARSLVYEWTEQNEPTILDSNKALSLGDIGADYDPDNINIFENLSMAYISLGRYDEASKTIEKGLAESGDKFKWILYRQRAYLHCMKQEFADAMTDLELASKQDNVGPTVWSLMAYCRAAAGKEDKFDEISPKAVQFQTNMAPGFHRRAEVRRIEGLYDKAIEDYSRALTMEDSTYYLSLRGRAQCYVKQGRLDKALADLEEADGINPHSAKTLSLLALVEDKIGKKQKADKDMTKAFALPSHPPICFVDRACIEFNNSKLNDSLNDLNHAISLDPYLKEAYELRAVINEKLGHTDDAANDRKMSSQLAYHVGFFP